MQGELLNLSLFALALGKCALLTGVLPGIFLYEAFSRAKARWVPTHNQGERWQVWRTESRSNSTSLSLRRCIVNSKVPGPGS